MKSSFNHKDKRIQQQGAGRSALSFNCVVTAALLLLLSQCVRPIDLDLPEEQTKVVINGNFEPGQPFQVKLSASQSVFIGSRPSPIETATVNIEREGQVFEVLEKTMQNGQIVWKSKKNTAKANVDYSITVSVPRLPVASAVSKAPYPLLLKTVTIQQDDMVIIPINADLATLRIPLDFQLSTSVPSHPYFGFSIQSVVDVYEDATLPKPVFDYTIRQPAVFSTDGRTFALLNRIPEPMAMLHENYWRDGRDTLHLVATIDYKVATDIPKKLFITWFTLSEAFYRYHLSVSRQGYNLPLSDPDALYNNIQDGYGNFSGFSRDTQTVVIPR